MSQLTQLLDTTSRTFALSIPLLPEPARTDVTIAYLVFRIADTLEDAELLESEQRALALLEFCDLLGEPTPSRSGHFAERWSGVPVTTNAAYATLLAETPYVLNCLRQRDSGARTIVRHYARQTASGMLAFQRQGSPHLRSLAELRQYCYVVAGIVGELLTDLFSLRIPGVVATPEVRRLALAFGEGLQLVNILKDSDQDAKCGRFFLPQSIDRGRIIELARRDLNAAGEYVESLRKAGTPAGYLAFTELPLQLAISTLDVVERDGPGSKVSRDHVWSIMSNLAPRAASENLPGLTAPVVVVPVVAKT